MFQGEKKHFFYTPVCAEYMYIQTRVYMNVCVYVNVCVHIHTSSSEMRGLREFHTEKRPLPELPYREGISPPATFFWILQSVWREGKETGALICKTGRVYIVSILQFGVLQTQNFQMDSLII